MNPNRIYKLDGGEMFEGDLAKFREVFFSNADHLGILDWAGSEHARCSTVEWSDNGGKYWYKETFLGNRGPKLYLVIEGPYGPGTFSPPMRLMELPDDVMLNEDELDAISEMGVGERITLANDPERPDDDVTHVERIQ